MTSREQFEAWFKREIIETPDFEFNAFDDDAGEYTVTEDDNIDLYLQVQAMYMAWQASREAVVVELPDEMKAREALDKGFMCDYAAGVTDTVVQMRENLLAADIKVKGE